MNRIFDQPIRSGVSMMRVRDKVVQDYSFPGYVVGNTEGFRVEKINGSESFTIQLQLISRTMGEPNETAVADGYVDGSGKLVIDNIESSIEEDQGEPQQQSRRTIVVDKNHYRVR